MQQRDKTEYAQMGSRNPHSDLDEATNYSVYASQVGRTNVLPLIVYMDWTAKLASALHFWHGKQLLQKLWRVTGRPFAHFLHGVNRP